ncbi:hypothetical protein E2562_036260, partial [Oryza meyeriana var. granulata]
MSTAADPSRPISLSGDSSPTSSSGDDSSPSSSAGATAAAGGGSDDPSPVDQIASGSGAGSAAAAGDEDAAAVPTSPRIGMYFETEEDAYEFYKAYAARLGFVVRKSNKSKNSRHTVTRRLFLLPSANAFRVTDFVAEHNHPLASAAPAVSLALLPPSSSHHTIATVASLPDPRDGPRTDMHFETEDDAYAFYNRYAEHVGFSVRRSYKKRKRGVIVSRIFVCSREGVSDRAKHESVAIVSTNASTGASGTPRPGPPPTRTGCQARMVIKITPCRTYRVAKFFAEHNHPLANPDSVHKLREQEDILQFLRRYETMLEEYRSKKLQADVDGSQ